jgi:sodium transport system ATP-binding protein
MSEVDLLCDELAIISKGNLIYSDTMANFRTQYAHQSLTEAFIDIVKHDGKQIAAV